MPIVPIKEPKLYSDGKIFIKYYPNGSSNAYYPSGNMACAHERMGPGFYCYFYSDTKRPVTLAAFDPFGEGFCSFPDGKPRLTSKKHGGTYMVRDAEGIDMMVALWTTAKKLKKPIVFELNKDITFTFQTCQHISARLNCGGLSHDYQLGDVPKMAEDNYLSKVTHQIKMGPERGKYMLDVDKCREAAAENRARREMMGLVEPPVAKTYITEETMQKHPQLRPVVASTSKLHETINAGEWNIDTFLSKELMATKLNDTMPTLRLVLDGDLPAEGTYDSHSKTFASLPATKPKILEALLKPSDFDNNALPLSRAIKGASGRYRPDHGSHYKTGRMRLEELKSTNFEEALKDAPKDQLVVVACTAGWCTPAKKCEETVLEGLNGEMIRAKKAEQAALSGGASRPPDSGFPNMSLKKFDMSESRYLRDKYGIRTLPMFLMYYGGRLCFASNKLNGFGTSKEDMIEQAKKSLGNAQRGVFLPEGFKFGETDDANTMNFNSTIAKTAPKIGAHSRMMNPG